MCKSSYHGEISVRLECPERRQRLDRVKASEVILLDKAIGCLFYSDQEILASNPTDCCGAALSSTRLDPEVQRGENEKAVADFTDAIRIGPKDASSYDNRGGIFLTKNEIDKAIADFTGSIRIAERGTPSMGLTA